jgi:hypothetical protein
MGIPTPAPTPNHRRNRLKGVAIGSGVTVAPVLVLAGVQLLLASSTVRKFGYDPTIDGLFVSEFQAALVRFHAWIVAIVFAYWLLTGTLGGGQFLKIKSANVALALSGLTFTFAMAIISVFPPAPTTFKVVCPALGLPDSMPPLPEGHFSFDGQTPCEAFANVAAPSVMFGMPLALLLTSAILRVVVSRRR